MKLSRILLSVIFLVSMITISYAGPLTNKEEYDGDKLLTKEQHLEYQRLLDQGANLYDEGKYSEAEVEFKKILNFAPKKNLAYFNLGLVKYKQGDYQAAIGYFDTVLKKRSYYVGAAFYYKAISHLNLNQIAEAKAAAKKITPARFFQLQSKNLMQAIETGSDEYYANAQAALTDGNFELCLLELEDSVLTDTQKGKDLINNCKVAMEAEVTKATAVKKEHGTRYELFFDARLSHSDNVYGEKNNVVRKNLYSATVGGEYVFKKVVDYGIRASYHHANAIDLANFKDEFINVGVPVYYSDGPNRYSANVYYDHAKANGKDAFAGAGVLANYFFNKDNYSFGVIGNASNKKSIRSNFDYRTGFYSTARLLVSKRMDALTLNAYAGQDQNLAGDEQIGASFIPYAHKALRYGASAFYELNKESKVIFRGNYADRSYENMVSANNIKRKDKNLNLSLAYEYKFNKNVKAFIQQGYTKNDSNYDNNEIINKNYTENLTTLGLSLITF